MVLGGLVLVAAAIGLALAAPADTRPRARHGWRVLAALLATGIQTVHSSLKEAGTRSSAAVDQVQQYAENRAAG